MIWPQTMRGWDEWFRGGKMSNEGFMSQTDGEGRVSISYPSNKEAQVAEVMRLADEYRAASDTLWRNGWDRPSVTASAALEAAVRKLAGL